MKRNKYSTPKVGDRVIVTNPGPEAQREVYRNKVGTVHKDVSRPGMAQFEVVLDEASASEPIVFYAMKLSLA